MDYTQVRLICQVCERNYLLNHSRGHSRKLCNSCSAHRFRIDFKRRCVEYLGGKCVKCGYHKSLNALHAHHLDPSTKRFNIAGSHVRKWSVVQEELDKCQLLCSNCHAEEHESPRWHKLFQMRVPKRERAVVSWPTKQRLRDLLNLYPVTTIAKEIGVSDTAVKKRCRKLGLVTRARGFWGRNGHSDPIGPLGRRHAK